MGDGENTSAIPHPAPRRTRERVVLEGWGGRSGVLIAPDKADQDAKNFRKVAARLRRLAPKDKETVNMALWLEGLATTFAAGED